MLSKIVSKRFVLTVPSPFKYSVTKLRSFVIDGTLIDPQSFFQSKILLSEIICVALVFNSLLRVSSTITKFFHKFSSLMT